VRQVTLAEVMADEFGVRLFGEPDVPGHPALFRRRARGAEPRGLETPHS